jgi:hypothetical protein
LFHKVPTIIFVSLIISATPPKLATTSPSLCSSSSKVTSFFVSFFHYSKFNLLLGWKRLVLADTPRQTINALTLYAVWLIKKGGPEPWYDISKYFKGNSLSTSALTVTTFFTVVVCAGSLLFLLVAAICYVPLLCHIQGNLKVHFFLTLLIICTVG